MTTHDSVAQRRRIDECRGLAWCWIIAALALALPRIAFAAPGVSTPRQTMESFLKAGRQGDFATAEQCFDLRDVPKAHRAEQGVLLAKELYYVLDTHVTVALATLPDEPQPSGQGDQVVAAEVPLGEGSIDIALSRVRLDDGSSGWLLSRATVAATPALYRVYGPPPFYFDIPQVLRIYEFLGVAAWQWIGLALALCSAYAVASLIVLVLRRIARAFARRTGTPWDDVLVFGVRRPVRLLVAIALYELLEPLLVLPHSAGELLDRSARIATIVAVGWLLAAVLTVGTAWATRFLAEDTANELKRRGLRTQLLLLRRVGTLLIGIFGGAVVLLQFELVRSVGVSLLASAGLAGIVLGLALQKSLTGIIAGIQISLTQPFRIGDMVVVEGEYGMVEQINLTYVVIRIWDERRLIVPMQRILEQPFQNWTKVTPELMGTVSIRCDYGTPVDTLRDEIERMCAASVHWDRRRCEVSVTDATDQKIELRIVVSAADADTLWRLRCELREKVVTYLAAHDMGRGLEHEEADASRARERHEPS